MKNFKRFSILAVMLLAFAGTAGALDFPTDAVVSIEAGIIIAETTPLNYGVLVLNPGAITISATGVVTDLDGLTLNGAAQSEGLFTVDSAIGSAVEVDCVPGVPAVQGLVLSAFFAGWDGAVGVSCEPALPAPHTMVALQDVLAIGATLTVSNAVVGANVSIPYTVAVNFQ
jgi:hypothetical protein